MKLTDIASLETWKQLEKTIHDQSGLNASVFDMNGARITGVVNWVNRLCPVIKANSRGQTFICSMAHQSVVTMVQKSRKPVIDECDAGLAKLAVPIFNQNNMIGVVSGCGLLLPDGEVDTFLIQKTIGGDEDSLTELAENINSITEEKLQEVINYIEQQIKNLKQEASVKMLN